jgi:hypothetical protein
MFTYEICYQSLAPFHHALALIGLVFNAPNAFIAPKSHQTMLCKTINYHRPDFQKKIFCAHQQWFFNLLLVRYLAFTKTTLYCLPIPILSLNYSYGQGGECFTLRSRI